MQLSDVARPLNKRGKRDAPLMAEMLGAMVTTIDLALVSPAKRAKDTSLHFIKRFKPKKVIKKSKLYHASTQTLLEVLRAIPIQYESVMIFGHNPGLTFIHNYFAEQAIDNLPTTGIFHAAADTDSWSGIDIENTKINFVIYPKMYITE